MTTRAALLDRISSRRFASRKRCVWVFGRRTRSVTTIEVYSDVNRSRMLTVYSHASASKAEKSRPELCNPGALPIFVAARVRADHELITLAFWR
jgi:hypothetical protein